MRGGGKKKRKKIGKKLEKWKIICFEKKKTNKLQLSCKSTLITKQYFSVK